MPRLFLFFILLIGLPLGMLAYSPSTVPNVHLLCADCYTSNPDKILSDSTVAALDELAAKLKAVSDVELAIVAIDSMSTDHADIYDFALDLFKTWGIGNAQTNSGVLMLLTLEPRRIRIQTGTGVEGLLPDATCKEIIEEDLVPALREDKYDEGMLAGAKSIARRLTTQEAYEELLPDKVPMKEAHNGWLTYFMIAFGVLIMMALIGYKLLTWKPEATNEERYQHAKNDGFDILLRVFRIFFPIPMLLFASWYRKACMNIRKKPINCPKCKHVMTLLSEDVEDAHLSDLAQKEEKIGSVDYDVWECSECHHRIRYSYIMSKIYSRCPECNGRTMEQTSDVVLKSATTYSSGVGEKTYKCCNCGFVKVKTYRIPKVTSFSLSGGSGGSSGGGSWGGGSSSGGGASGSF